MNMNQLRDRPTTNSLINLAAEKKEARDVGEEPSEEMVASVVAMGFILHS